MKLKRSGKRPIRGELGKLTLKVTLIMTMLETLTNVGPTAL